MTDFDPPFVDFFVKDNDLPFETAERDVTFLAGHEAFFLANFFNVAYLVIFEHYVFRTLTKNFTLQLVLVGCATQAISCFTSLVRYDIDEEYSGWAIAGVFTGNAAFAFLNAAITVLFFDAATGRRGHMVWTIVMGVIAVCLTASSILSYIYWDDIKFDIFRLTVPISELYFMGCLIYCLVMIKKKKVEAASMPLSTEMMERLLRAILAITVVAFLLMVPRIPMVTYPNTGWVFSASLIFFKFAGNISFNSPTGTVGETTSLVV